MLVLECSKLDDLEEDRIMNPYNLFFVQIGDIRGRHKLQFISFVPKIDVSTKKKNCGTLGQKWPQSSLSLSGIFGVEVEVLSLIA